MKRVWTIVSFIAVVNLLTIVFVGLWMWQTGRLDNDRLGELREWIVSPAGIELDESNSNQTESGHEVVEVASGLSSEQRLAWVDHWRMQSEQRLQSLVDEAERRGLEVQVRLAELEVERRALEDRRQKLEMETDAEATQRSDEGFHQTVRLYESARPATAKAWLLALIEEGRMERAVEYLKAMNARSAGRVLRAFDTGIEIQLAKQLLEGMSGDVVFSPAEDPANNAHAHIEPISTP